MLFIITEPTAPITKSGPELLQKGRSFFASFFVILFSLYKSHITEAPVGYPQIIPIIKAKAPLPSVLKSALHIGVSGLLIKSAKPVLIKILENTKKGKRVGIITFTHKRSEDFTDKETVSDFISEKIISVIKKAYTESGFKTKKLTLFFIESPLK